MSLLKRFAAAYVTVLLLSLVVFWVLQLRSQLLMRPPWELISIVVIVASVSAFRFSYGFSLAVFLLPFLEGIHFQLKSWNMDVVWLADASVEPILGLVLGFFVNLLRYGRAFLTRFKSPPVLVTVLLFLHCFILFEVILTIYKNLFQSASMFSYRGIYKYLENLRFYDRMDDYAPLRFLYLYTAAAVAGLFAYATLTDRKSCESYFIRPLIWSAVVIVSYGLGCYLFNIGYNRNGLNGINSFFPDLHTYAGFLLPFFTVLVSSIQVLNTKTTFKWQMLFFLLILVSLILTGSKSSVFIAGLFLVFFLFLSLGVKRTGLWLFPCLLAGAAVIFASMPKHNSVFVRIAKLFEANSFESFNTALSYRPELFATAVKLWSDYPLLGIGIGSFPRQGSLFEYSHSEYMRRFGPENAHNYFLQLLSEQGLIGLLLFGLIVGVSLFEMQRRGYRKLFFASIGLLLGNLFAHSLLVPSIFILFCILCFSCYGDEDSRIKRHSISLRPFGVLAILAFCVGAYEYFSFKRKSPFKEQGLCYRDILHPDGWTSGEGTVVVSRLESGVRLEVGADHPDVRKNPIDVHFSLYNGDEHLDSYVRTYTTQDRRVEEFPLNLGSGESKDIRIQIKSARCYVPLNFGVNSDRRHLGVRIFKS